MTALTVPIIESPEQRKGRGAFYTPPAITRFLARWAVRAPDERVIEPSCGDGAFIVALTDRYAELGRTELASTLLGIELVPDEARRAAAFAPTASIRTGSFFDLEPADVGHVSTVIGNPPYIRYHGWTGESRSASLHRAASLGVQLTGLASSWASFVVWATAFLPDRSGRLALVLPAELLSTEYAEPVRRFLVERFSSIIVIAFDDPAFASAQVDAVLLLASMDDDRGMRVVRLPSASALSTTDITPPGGDQAATATETRSDPRWTGSVDLDAAAVYDELLRAGRVVPLGDIASVDIGFVSGANDYFVLDDAEVRRLGLPAEALRRTVERPKDLRGIEVHPDEERWLFLPPGEGPASAAVEAYLEHGMARGIPSRYKPRMRRQWSRVPLPKAQADAFLPYMSHRGPRLITNPSGAVSSNLLHGVTFRDRSTDPRVIAASMLSSATRLSAEIEGRAYGGGVLKVETKEAERLVLPRLAAVQGRELARVFDQLDAMVRAGRGEEASDVVDRITELDHDNLSLAADIYRDRRLSRGRRRSAVAGP